MDKISYKIVKELVKNSLFEDLGGIKDANYGIYDRPVGERTYGDPEEETTVPPDVPLKPTEMMAVQLADERPPIEDENFTPGNADELSRAASAMSRLVPSDQIEFFYRELHRLLDDATDKHNSPDLAKSSEEDEDMAVPLEAEETQKESRLREAAWGEADPRYEDSEENLSIIDASEEMASQPQDDGLSFEEIAEMEGLAGASGARQLINRLTSRMNYFATTASLDDLKRLKTHAVDVFVTLLEAEAYIDAEDAKELRAAPDQVKSLDSFRFFFVSAFVLPGYKDVNRRAAKEVEAEMDRMGAPQGMRQTIMNQVTGQSERDPQLIAKKLQAVAQKEGLTDEEIQSLGGQLKTGFSRLIKLAEPSPDIVDISIAKWAKSRKDKQREILRQSLQSTLDLQAAE